MVRMNFLAHLWLAERTRTSPAGAILGDRLRGRIPADLPPALALAIRLHRRVDAQTDRHPLIQTARGRFAGGERRYAGIVLDMVCDHLLAQRWSEFSTEALPEFAHRAALAVTDDPAWPQHAASRTADAEDFRRLLLSYVEPDGIDRAFVRIGGRMSRPQALLEAARRWTEHATDLNPDFPRLLSDLSDVARDYVRAAQAA